MWTLPRAASAGLEAVWKAMRCRILIRTQWKREHQGRHMILHVWIIAFPNSRMRRSLCRCHCHRLCRRPPALNLRLWDSQIPATRFRSLGHRRRFIQDICQGCRICICSTCFLSYQGWTAKKTEAFILKASCYLHLDTSCLQKYWNIRYASGSPQFINVLFKDLR